MRQAGADRQYQLRKARKKSFSSLGGLTEFRGSIFWTKHGGKPLASARPRASGRLRRRLQKRAPPDSR